MLQGRPIHQYEVKSPEWGVLQDQKSAVGGCQGWGAGGVCGVKPSSQQKPVACGKVSVRRSMGATVEYRKLLGAWNSNRCRR